MATPESRLAQRKQDGLFRTLPNREGGIDFCSNDYLGFARSVQLAELIEAEYALLAEVKNGSTGSRLLTGNEPFIEQLEVEIANFHHSDAALIYASGYTANLGVISCLAQRGDTIIMDEYCHASMIDGARLSLANRHRFKHNDIDDLRQKLQNASEGAYVLIESVYSMDGSQAGLSEIAKVCQDHNATLIVDEAHAIGVMGQTGGGLSELHACERDIPIRIVTYGKAMGCHGAAVLCSDEIRDTLINFSRPFIYSTAPSPHHYASIKAAYALLAQIDTIQPKRQRLVELITHFRHHIEEFGAEHWLESHHPIQSMVIGSNKQALACSDLLKEEGFDVLAIRSPTVPAGSERLRFCLHDYNTKEEIDNLFNALTTWKRKM